MYENFLIGRFFFSRIFLYDMYGNDMLDNVLDIVREWIIVLDSELFILFLECRKLINEVVEMKIKYYIFVRD